MKAGIIPSSGGFISPSPLAIKGVELLGERRNISPVGGASPQRNLPLVFSLRMKGLLQYIIRMVLGVFILPMLLTASLLVSAIAFCSDRFVRTKQHSQSPTFLES